MKMKNLFLILFSLVTTISYSQNTISFKIKDGNIKVAPDPTKLKLPIELEFSKDFKDKTVKIVNDLDEIIALKNGKFGSNGFTPLEGTTSYNIQIDENGKVNPLTEGDKKIEGKKIKLKIENFDPIVLTFDEVKPNTPTDGKQTSNDKYQPGYIYYDALKLATEKEPMTINSILEAYGYNSSNISNNPYLNEIFPMTFAKSTPSGGLSLLGYFGNTDVTYFAAGLARFLAERTKEELNEAFFNKMKEQLNAYPELKTAFPKTANILEVIETFSYASVIQVLKEAFETDIQNLPENLYNIKDLTRSDCDTSLGKKLSECQARLDKIEEFFKTMEGQWIGLGMFTVKEAAQSSNPYDLLSSISASKELDGIKSDSKQISNYDAYNLASSIELANFISQSLKSNDENRIWITPKELNALFRDNDLKTFKIFLGLLLAKEQKGDVKIDFYYSNGNSKTLGGVLKDIHLIGSDINNAINVYEQTKTLIRNTYTAFNAANNAIKKITTATEKSIEAEPQALYDYYRTFIASLKPIANSKILKTITHVDIDSLYNVVEQFLNPAVDMAYHIATKKYSAALYDAVLLLGNAKASAFKPPVIKSLIKYGTLISTVANAQSSDEVKKAIEASVLPVGSYSIKRKTNWSCGINAYVGAFWSYSNTAASKDYLPPLGLAAPISFNISKGFSKTGKAGGLSLNLQILDVGALVNYYLLKGDTASLPNDFKVRLSNIFSPGFNLCYNVPKTPLSLAWGGQYVPTLYQYEQINGTNQLTPTSAFRMQLSVLVDIPMFHLKVRDFKK